MALGCGHGAAQTAGQVKLRTYACGGGEIAHERVTQASDGRTLTLADGRQVRLAAIEVPAMPLPEERAIPPGGASAKAALDALAKGDDVVFRAAGQNEDRYGRLFGYAYTERDGDELFVQGELVSAGLARVGDLIGSGACATDLLARETAARAAGLGLWSDPYYHPLDAGTPANVLAHRGEFALVEGTVASVRERGATIYVNFGSRWSEDFSVTVRKRNERNFAGAGLDVKGLTGRHVIVRGFIEARGARHSPSIEASSPEQIEAADRD